MFKLLPSWLASFCHWEIHILDIPLYQQHRLKTAIYSQIILIYSGTYGPNYYLWLHSAPFTVIYWNVALLMNIFSRLNTVLWLLRTYKGPPIIVCFSERRANFDTDCGLFAYWGFGPEFFESTGFVLLLLCYPSETQPTECFFLLGMGVQPAAHGPHVTQDGCECSPTQNRKFT